MQKCTMHMHNATTKPRKLREGQINPTKLTKEKSAIKRGNKPQAPLAIEQRCPSQEVWLGYLQFASLKGHESSLCGLSHDCLAGSGTGYLCVWFWSVRQGSFAMLIADMLSTNMGTLSKLSP